MIDYNIFYRQSILLTDLEKNNYDIFISAYNESDRVNDIFQQISAKHKIWLIHPEYNFSIVEEPDNGLVVRPDTLDTKNQVHSLITLIQSLGDIENLSICIDITGFMRHVLVFLVSHLKLLKVKKFNAVYTEPKSYSKQEETSFSIETTGKATTVKGMSSVNYDQEGKDYLIIGVGYDHQLINIVTSSKENIEIYPIFSFPSLSADMYQQSALRAARSGEVTLNDQWFLNRFFSPANDPFSTARTVQEIIAKIEVNSVISTVYLSPLSTKVQALGFAIYWCLEGQDRGDVSILLPESLKYARETSIGTKRIWLYEVELILS